MVDEVSEQKGSGGEAGCLLRLLWMFAGNTMLCALLLIIALSDSGPLSFVSIAFWIVTGLVVLARHVDVTRYGGTKADGETPATLRDVKYFSSLILGLSGTAWVLVQAL